MDKIAVKELDYKPTDQWIEGREDALELIRNERRNQLMKWGIRGRSGSVQETDFLMLAVLMEEVGEVATAMINGDEDNLRDELSQVAAVAATMIQMIDKGEG